MEEVFDAAFVADEPETLIDEESRDRTGWHTEALRPAELSPALMSWKIVGQSRQDGRAKSRNPGQFSRSGFGRRLGRFGRGLWLRRGIGGPEMASAVRAYPELIRRPRPIRGRVPHFHLGSAPHTPDLEVAHGLNTIRP